jgi:hypothetical protein
VRTAAEIAALVRIDPALVEERGEAVVDAVQRTVAMLAEEGERRGEPLPLIGFAGARSPSPPTSWKAARRRTTSAPAASSTPTPPPGPTSRPGSPR